MNKLTTKHYNNIDTRCGFLSDFKVEVRVNCNWIIEDLMMWAAEEDDIELSTQVQTIGEHLECEVEKDMFWEEFNRKCSAHPQVMNKFGSWFEGRLDAELGADGESELLADIWKLAFDEWVENSELQYKTAVQKFHQFILEEYGEDSEQTKKYKVGSFNGVAMPIEVEGRTVISYPNAGIKVGTN